MSTFTNRQPPIRPFPDGSLVLDAPCKLNLGLHIFPPRPDGFHNLESWMVPISWHDTLTYRVNGQTAACLKITGQSAGIPTELEQNLVGRAMRKLAAAAGRDLAQSGDELTLHKVVPPGGGLGGGSSDAAHALLLLNVAWKLHWEVQKLLPLAAELGSDVPFFVHAKPALCQGRGELLTPLPPHAPLYAVLLLSPTGLATKPVYQAFDAGHRPAEGRGYAWDSWSRLSANQLNEALLNDLEPPAFFLAPWLAELREKAARRIGQKIHMTGSGSALFTLCDSAPRAAALAEQLRDRTLGDIMSIPVRILRQRE